MASGFLLLLATAACGNSGGEDTTATTAATPTTGAFVAQGTTAARTGSRTLRVSVGSPTPVVQSEAGGRNLSLGPNALRP